MTAISRLTTFHTNIFLFGIVLSAFGIVIGTYVGVKLSYSQFEVMCLMLVGYTGSLLVQAALYCRFYKPILNDREVEFLKWAAVACSVFAAAWLVVGWLTDGDTRAQQLARATIALLLTILPLNAATVLPAHLSQDMRRKRSGNLN